MDAVCQHCHQSHPLRVPRDPPTSPVCDGCGRELQFVVDQLEMVAIVQYRLARLRRSSA
jgi:hypothetical protein